MDLYPLVVFVHVVGALALFAALGLEWSSVRRLRRATTGWQAIESIAPLASLRRVYPGSMVLILASGVYLAATRWGHIWWGMIAVVAMVLMAVIGRVAAGGRTNAIREAAIDQNGTLAPALRARLADPVVWGSIQARIVIGLGIIFLMTARPGLAGSLVTLGVALVIAASLALPWRQQKALRAAN